MLKLRCWRVLSPEFRVRLGRILAWGICTTGSISMFPLIFIPHPSLRFFPPTPISPRHSVTSEPESRFVGVFLTSLPEKLVTSSFYSYTLLVVTLPCTTLPFVIATSISVSADATMAVSAFKPFPCSESTPIGVICTLPY
jgi:hypothetical protein